MSYISLKRVFDILFRNETNILGKILHFCSDLCLLCVRRCGLRGGYMEIINMDPAVKVYVRNMYLSPSVIPQLAMEVMVNPPTPGDPSYDLYSQVTCTTRVFIRFKT